MTKGNFIWADLSTYNTTTSIRFYTEVFGWDIIDNDGYFMSAKDSYPIAGIYETPPFFQKIKMPHFWMSYFQVDSASAAAETAEAHGGKVELKDKGFNNGQIALIRDPQGAGFTVYDGNELFLNSRQGHGAITETELHVSDTKKVLPFYSQIFNWKYIESEQGTYKVGGRNITIREIPNSIKGKFEYWVTTILVKDLKYTTNQIIKNGGGVISEEYGRNLMTDNSGESFFYIKER